VEMTGASFPSCTVTTPRSLYDVVLRSCSLAICRNGSARGKRALVRAYRMRNDLSCACRVQGATNRQIKRLLTAFFILLLRYAPCIGLTPRG
jgi:hypothetical protein